MNVFRYELWVMILATTLLIAMIKSCIMILFSSIKVAQFFGFVWTSLIAYFGAEPSETTIDEKKSYKAIMILSLLGGSVIWIGFNASLTSALAIVVTKMPFNNFESFSKTNWR